MKSLMVGFLSLLAVGFCRTWTVSPDGSGDFTTIQEALYASVDGDTILVKPAVYRENINFAGRRVTVTSENPDDPNVVAATIIDGTITFFLNETLNSVLEGFSIRGRVFPVSVGSYEQTAPRIYGSIVVWQDKRNYSDTGYDIYAMDLSTGLEAAICTAAGDQIAPDVYGDRVVWQDYRNSSTAADIYGLTLSTSEEFIVSNGMQDEAAPAIYGDTVVWQDNRAGVSNYDIYGKNLSTSTEFAVNTSTNNQLNPAICDVVVVWQDYRSGSRHDIYAKNIQTGSGYVVSNVTANKINPAISSTYIVWEDYRNGNADIYSKNRSTNQEAVVVSTTAFQTFPAVYGDVVLWQDNRGGNYDIYSKNLTSSTQTVICSASGSQTLPAVSGNEIVWSDARWGTPLIVYMDTARTDTHTILCSYADATIQKNVFNTTENAITGQYEAAPDILSNMILLAEAGISGCRGRIVDNLIELGGTAVYSCSGVIESNILTLNGTALSGCDGMILSNTISLNTIGIYNCGGTISDNTISQNTSYGFTGSDGTISDNRIIENEGAGIASGGDSETEITGNYLVSNAAGITGVTAAAISRNVITLNQGDGLASCTAGIISNNIVSQNTGYGINACTALVSGNTLVENSSAGIKAAASSQVIKNNILVENGGYGIEGGTISYNCFWQNTAGIYSGSIPGLGNTAANPLFADMDDGDYHLKSQIGRWDPNTEVWVLDSQTSPCIDGGDSADSVGQEPNPNGGRVNMGAFGGTDQASLSPNGNGQIVPICTDKPTMDFDGDCKVNLADFVLFTEQWLSCGLIPQDACD